ncbi:alpha-2-glucosyltransferase Alg10 [Mucor mucedo]|uniref:alpha-2-glucosyltransferase Alg10 n=1 Tax=Mucor mucedo TaxID=29922 RepID=UPI002220871D|nr:alpha-2-glucosyltransferase Alg10 [Mucor mucedo]KAI7897317.1 alpha-2-glucosyltransferase Alg10 [Mucor mucedo]
MAFILHVANLLFTSQLVNSHVPQPYMDEIFHIPQAQQYCGGDYLTWDPKLTTPPGLYLISNVIAYVGSLFHVDLCTVNALRFTNILFSIGLYFVLVSLISTLSNKTTSSSWQTSLYALSLSWFPVSFFFNFLYYTDPGSTFFVLSCYLLVKKKHYFLAGIAGLISLTFRQTNVIWVCLFMMVVIIDTLSAIPKKKEDAKGLYNPRCSTITHPAQVMKSITSLLLNTLQHFMIVLPNIATFLVAIISFAGFLVWNGGIVLGDRSNHMAGLHFPQLFYYTSFLSFFASPWTLSMHAMANLLQLNIKRTLIGIVSAMVTLALIHRYTYEHPFLLSDNRHYTFYIWKRIYKRHWTVRYLLTPVYYVSGILNLSTFAQHTSFLVSLGYSFALVLTLVPSPLLEFRYFIIPFLFFMVHIPPPTQISRTLLGLALYLVIHVVTIYLFLYKPFAWPNEPNATQRFMW